MKRKSPYRHPVRSYVREGKRIDRYMRGEGKKPRESGRVVGSASKGTRWRVSSLGSSVIVGAGDIVQGLSRGIGGLAKTGETVTIKKV